MPQILSKRYFLSGRVQGVGCRAQIERRAQGIEGLSGWVRNLSDGRVEVQGWGDEAALGVLEAVLREGLRFPVRVDSLEVKEGDGIPGPRGFSVRADG